MKRNDYWLSGLLAVVTVGMFIPWSGMPALSAQEVETAAFESLNELQEHVLPELQQMLTGAITPDANRDDVLYIEIPAGGPLTVSLLHLWEQVQGRTAKAQQQEIRAFLNLEGDAPSSP